MFQNPRNYLGSFSRRYSERIHQKGFNEKPELVFWTLAILSQGSGNTEPIYRADPGSLSLLLVVIASFHAPVERHRKMKMGSPRLMVRQPHHERVPGPFVLNRSKGGRALFIAAKP